METQLVQLPQEVAQIAENVSVEKRNEVQTVLNHVFNGVSKMREQLDSVIVVDENDKVNMKLANTIRLGVRQVRLEAEKTFDAKRSEVQQQMLSYKTEDSLWLKAKQTMQILTKEIEENARWKEETRERFEKEQKELKVQQRIIKVSKVAPEMLRSEFENMSDETFEMFFTGIEKAYNDKIEAEKKAEAERIEKENKQKVFEERRYKLAPFMQFYSPEVSGILTIETTESEFNIIIEKLEKAKKDYDIEQENIRIENERLKAEAEAKEKQLAEERAKAESERKAIEEKAKKEREESERILLAERKLAAEKLEVEIKNARKLAAEFEAKKLAEEKAKKEAEEKAIAEQKAKEAAEKKAKNAPDKTKLIELAMQIESLNMPEIKGEEAQKILSDVKGLLLKLSGFIREKTNNL